jgi:two-component system chemotaxis sensor kinase CheA
VDGVTEVLRIPLASVESPSQMIANSDSAYIRGITKLGDKLVILLDLDKVLAGAEYDSLRTMKQDNFGLENVLGRQNRRAETGEHNLIVVIKAGERLAGLIVDELMERQEIVVKPLGSYLGDIEGISGATILGDGKVALILDAASLSKMMVRGGPISVPNVLMR